MNPLEVLPDRKKQLFLARLNGEAVENGVIITSPLATTPANNTEKERSDSVSSSSVPTKLDSFASPKESSRHEAVSPEAGSRSSSRLSVKENRQKINVVAEKEGSAKRPLEFDSSDSIGLREESKPKSKRTEIIIDSPEPEKSSVVVTGSAPLNMPF